MYITILCMQVTMTYDTGSERQEQSTNHHKPKTKPTAASSNRAQGHTGSVAITSKSRHVARVLPQESSHRVHVITKQPHVRKALLHQRRAPPHHVGGVIH